MRSNSIPTHSPLLTPHSLLSGPPLRRLRLLGSLALLLALGPPTLRAQVVADSTTLELRFLDVGQGDAIVIRLGPQAMLIDASRGRDIVLYFEDLGIKSFVATIASHNHDDHIGGMPAVLADYAVGQYLYNQRPPENQNSREVEHWLAEKHIPHPPPPWEAIHLGDARITVFPTRVEPALASENNCSLGVLVERGKFRALLTGDSEVEELNAWLKAGIIPTVDVLKAAHHGARNGVTPGWLLATRPAVVIISVGASNSYGHPDPWALRYYQADGRKVFRTDRDGTVVVTVDGEGRYEVRSEK